MHPKPAASYMCVERQLHSPGEPGHLGFKAIYLAAVVCSILWRTCTNWSHGALFPCVDALQRDLERKKLPGLTVKSLRWSYFPCSLAVCTNLGRFTEDSFAQPSPPSPTLRVVIH